MPIIFNFRKSLILIFPYKKNYKNWPLEKKNKTLKKIISKLLINVYDKISILKCIETCFTY